MTERHAVTTMSPSAARILMAGTEPDERRSLRDALTTIGYDVVADASGGTQVVELANRLQPDLVMILLSAEQPDWLDATAKIIASVAPVVLIGDPSTDLGAIARDLKIAGALSRPARESDLLPVVEVALARHADMRDLRERAAELEDALETRKVVERAKGILMDLHGLSEADAFRRMRKTSMDNRKTMREVAEAILLSHDLQLGSDII